MHGTNTHVFEGRGRRLAFPDAGGLHGGGDHVETSLDLAALDFPHSAGVAQRNAGYIGSVRSCP
jgi:hypothetical protein